MHDVPALELDEWFPFLMGEGLGLLTAPVLAREFHDCNITESSRSCNGVLLSAW